MNRKSLIVYLLFFLILDFSLPQAAAWEQRWSPCEDRNFFFPESLGPTNSPEGEDCYVSLAYKLKAIIDEACSVKNKPQDATCSGTCRAVEYSTEKVVPFLGAYEISFNPCTAKLVGKVKPRTLRCTTICSLGL